MPSRPAIATSNHAEKFSTIADTDAKPALFLRFYQTTRSIILSSWLNLLLVFVPIGIAVKFANASPTLVFAMNAIAIVPLARLLSYATESVARRMGDTIGALMNVTFGNAVELIIFDPKSDSEAEKKLQNEIRIVQASLLGSILANLLLILGMCFLVGGLRFREQIYNSTVTQMSACLLSLSVMSLLLPTAFHASFTDSTRADLAVLKVSRGSSVILLLVYALYLLFQLKSHAYMYESTPQHIIDEESHPGVLADIMGSSTSTDTSHGSSSSDSDGSSGSHTTANRIRRVIRKGRKRRKSSVSSKDVQRLSPTTRSGSVASSYPVLESREIGSDAMSIDHVPPPPLDDATGLSGDEADIDGIVRPSSRRQRAIKIRDFEKSAIARKAAKESKKRRKEGIDVRLREKEAIPLKNVLEGVADVQEPEESPPPMAVSAPVVVPEAPRSMKRPFTLRQISRLSTLPKPTLTNTGSSQIINMSSAGSSAGVTQPRLTFGIRRTASLPERLDQQGGSVVAPLTQPLSYIMPSANVTHLSTESADGKDSSKYISKTAAIILLIVSTSLVAVCAEFLVDSIDYFVSHTGVSEAFVGLILLPIVGNAAEHVTAVTVAAKNKMDLAIGVALGSSIQIALFVTPVVVLLGWILNKDMSLYFTLFETISLFVSAFIVNFLVLDGRSNYLEGALLCAAYVIIALAAFFYPDSSQQSTIGGSS
ncbi:MAG: hypothetical protein M1838_000275 [Thelocarpon superellum]|nr:MAG: hypothetical protein M1838_000275 [Thelocarpon superellum]